MRVVFLALALFATAAAVEPPRDQAAFHVFVLMGQSNMAGSGLPILEEYREPSARVLVQAPDLSWTGARTPLRGGGMSPGESFARHYAELHPGITVGLIQCARGARSLKELAKGGKDRDGAPNYDNTVKCVAAAAKQGLIKGVLWHQGESDSGDAGYVKRLATLAADLRADLGDGQLPFLCGELGRYAAWTSGFNTRLAAAAQEIPRCAVASSEGLLDLGDKVHFSSFSAEILGARYLMRYLELVEPALAPRFAPQLEEITTRMQARDAAWTGILDGDMSEGTARPFAWDGAVTGTLAVTRDLATVVSAPASLRLATTGGPGKGAVGQPLRNVTGRTTTITAQVKNAGFTVCRLVVIGIDGSWKQVLDQPVIDAAGAKDWTAFSGKIAIPANVPNCRLAVQVEGEGSAWVDDVAISVAETPVQAGTELLTDPGMDAGGAAPTGWTTTWAGTGKVASIRDTQVFKTGPAGLRVESVGGAAKGNASQALANVAGRRLHLTGWVKSDGVVAATAGIAAFDANWKQLSWETLYAAKPGAGGEWASFDKTVTIPADAVHVNVSATIEGDGKAWFDEFSAAAVP